MIDANTFRLDGRIALVTGSSTGIGLAIARGFAESGATVVLNARNAPRLAAAAAALEASGLKVHARAFDVSDAAAVQCGIADIEASVGAIDILVNNAAIFDMAPIVEVTRASFDRVFDINVRGLFFTLQAVANAMIARGKGGRIINIASQAGRRGEALVSVYCASKAAVISLTQSAGLDLIRHRINVNGIAPGVVDTPMWDTVDALFARYEGLPVGEKKRQVGLAVPYGRMGTPEDLAGAAVFLASDDADYVVAQTFNIDGGNWMS